MDDPGNREANEEYEGVSPLGLDELGAGCQGARQTEQRVQVDEDEVPLARLQELGRLAVQRKSAKSSSRGSRASGSGQ